MIRAALRYFAVVTALAACVASEAERARDPGAVASAVQLLAHFDRVVFNDQFDPKREVGLVRKWVQPIHIALSGDEAPGFRAAVAGHAATLAALTRLPIALAAPGGASANFEIKFVHWDDMEKAAKEFAPRPDWLDIIIMHTACLFIYHRNDRFEITRALVLVSTRETAAVKQRCLLEEMTQALGLPNDSDLVRPSIFNTDDKLDILATVDRIMVRTLYDPRIAPGLPRARALELARAIMAESGSR